MYQKEVADKGERERGERERERIGGEDEIDER